MRKSFRVLGETGEQSLGINLPLKRGEVSILVPGKPGQTEFDLKDRAEAKIKLHCSIGLSVCDVEVSVDMISGNVVDSSAGCNRSDCPFGLNDQGGGSGDREPRQPIQPIDSLSVQVS